MDNSMDMSQDKSTDSVHEEAAVFSLMKSFAQQILTDDVKTVITDSIEDYFLHAQLHESPRGLVYHVDVMRTFTLEDIQGCLFTVAMSPGVVEVSYFYSEWNSIPTNNAETKAICGPMWGVHSVFEYPEEVYEVEALYDRANGTF